MTPSDSGAFAARMVGVEEELMLVDPESGVLVPCGQEIVAGTVTASQCAPARGWGPVIKPEFFLKTSAAVIFPGRCCSGSSQRLRWRRGEANTDCVGWTASRYFHVGTRRHWALVVRPEGPWTVPIARRTPECLHLHRWGARGTAPARFGDGASPRPGLTPQIPGGAAATLGDRRVYVKPPEGRLTASDFRGRGAGHRTRCPPDRSTR